MSDYSDEEYYDEDDDMVEDGTLTLFPTSTRVITNNA